MKRFAVRFGFLAILLLIQTGLGSLLPRYFTPDLVLFGIVYFSLRRGPVMGVFLGLLIGLVQDVYAYETLGAHALSKCLVGYLVGLFDVSHFTFTPLTKLILLFSGLLVHDFVFNLASGLGFYTSLINLFTVSLSTGMTTLLIAIPIFYYLKFGNSESND